MAAMPKKPKDFSGSGERTLKSSMGVNDIGEITSGEKMTEALSKVLHQMGVEMRFLGLWCKDCRATRPSERDQTGGIYCERFGTHCGCGTGGKKAAEAKGRHWCWTEWIRDQWDFCDPDSCK